MVSIFSDSTIIGAGVTVIAMAIAGIIMVVAWLMTQRGGNR